MTPRSEKYFVWALYCLNSIAVFYNLLWAGYLLLVSLHSDLGGVWGFFMSPFALPQYYFGKYTGLAGFHCVGWLEIILSSLAIIMDGLVFFWIICDRDRQRLYPVMMRAIHNLFFIVLVSSLVLAGLSLAAEGCVHTSYS